MTPPLAVIATAEAFWSDSGEESTFPRDIRRAVTLSQPISVVMLSALHVAKVEAWLRRRGVAIGIDVVNRPLRACLVAHAGSGIIFVDGADPEDEQRFSIAHEIAHFLADYLAPRLAAVARLGEEILDVLDGRRPARTEERIVGILTNVEVRQHIHLMDRFEHLNMSATIEQSESMADALAFELIAPWADVSQHIAAFGACADRAAISCLLMDRYGLPNVAAQRYAAHFCPVPLPTSQLLRHLERVELAAPPRNKQ